MTTPRYSEASRGARVVGKRTPSTRRSNQPDRNDKILQIVMKPRPERFIIITVKNQTSRDATIGSSEPCRSVVSIALATL